MQRFIVLSTFIFLIFCGKIFAVELIVYKDKVKTSHEDLVKLINDEDGNLNDKEIFQSIRKKLLPNETIEYQGLTIETENAWIAEKLDEAEKNKDVWYERIVEVEQRLSAIQVRIDLLQAETEADFSKQDNKQKLDEILSRKEFENLVKKEKKIEEESWLQQQIKAFFEWLKSLFPQPKSIDGVEEGFQSLSLIIQIVVISLAVGLLGLFIYKFAPFIAAKIGNRSKKTKGTRVILGEKILADQSSADLLDEAERLARAGEMRLAIRKGYVALLCELSDRKLIGLAQHKTNRDYLRDVRKHQNIFRNMNFLTNSFETHWYGFASADEKDWEEFRTYYRETLSK